MSNPEYSAIGPSRRISSWLRLAGVGWCDGVFHTIIARSARARSQDSDFKRLSSPERYFRFPSPAPISNNRWRMPANQSDTITPDQHRLIPNVRAVVPHIPGSLRDGITRVILKPMVRLDVVAHISASLGEMAAACCASLTGASPDVWRRLRRLRLARKGPQCAARRGPTLVKRVLLEPWVIPSARDRPIPGVPLLGVA